MLAIYIITFIVLDLLIGHVTKKNKWDTLSLIYSIIFLAVYIIMMILFIPKIGIASEKLVFIGTFVVFFYLVYRIFNWWRIRDKEAVREINKVLKICRNRFSIEVYTTITIFNIPSRVDNIKITFSKGFPLLNMVINDQDFTYGDNFWKLTEEEQSFIMHKLYEHLQINIYTNMIQSCLKEEIND